MSQILENRYLICTPLRRIISFIIDCLFLIFFFRFVLFSIFVNYNWDIKLDVWQSIISPAILALVILICKDILLGKSIGKYFSSIVIKVITNFYPKPTLIQLLLRNFTLFVFPIDLFFLLTDKYSRRLGDKISGTFVLLDKKSLLKDNPVRWFSKRVIFFIFLLTIIVSGYFIVAPIQIKKSYAYSLATKKLESSFNKEFGRVIAYGYWTDFYYKQGNLHLNLPFRGQYFDGIAQIILQFDNKKYYSIKHIEIIKK